MTEPSDRRGVVLLAVGVEGGLIVAAELVGRLLGRPPLMLVRWDLPGLLWGLAATVPMVLIFLAMVRWPVGPLARIKQITDEVLVPLLSPCTVMDLLGISLLAGLGEEMLFRGVLQGWLQEMQWMPPWLAILLVSVLFGLMHALTFTYALFATAMGAFMAGLWLWTDNLLAPIIAHALYDFLALLYLLRGPGSLPLEAAEEMNDPS